MASKYEDNLLEKKFHLESLFVLTRQLTPSLLLKIEDPGLQVFVTSGGKIIFRKEDEKKGKKEEERRKKKKEKERREKDFEKKSPHCVCH